MSDNDEKVFSRNDIAKIITHGRGVLQLTNQTVNLDDNTKEEFLAVANDALDMLEDLLSMSDVLLAREPMNLEQIKVIAGLAKSSGMFDEL